MKLIYKALTAATATAVIIGAATTAQLATVPPAAKLAGASTSLTPRPGRTTPAPTPAPTLSASPTQLSIVGTTAAASTQTLSVTYHGGTGFLEVTRGAAFAPNPTVTALGDGRFTVTLRSSDLLPEGTYRGDLRLRVCAQMPCAAVLASLSVPYRLTLKWADVGEWETFQRDAGHTGHVPIVVNPARISRAWQWQRANPAGPKSINAVVTEAGRVFISENTYHNDASLYALNEADGSLAWQWDFGSVPALNPPAVSGGRVYIATTGHEATALWAFRASDGAPLWTSPFDGQWPNVLAPTVRSGRVYTNGGYYGGGVYAFNAVDGTRLWSRNSGDDDMTTPAVDDNGVYFYDGTGLKVYAAANGNSLASLADPYLPGTGYSYHAAPMLGSSDNIIAFSGGAFSGMASSEAEQYESRGLVNFSVVNYATRWRTAKVYKTQPAVAKGVIYAATNSTRSLDAISEANGQVLWSWSPGPTDTTEFHRNVVVTRNLVFVSTELAVYAVDLATRKAVWSAPTPGVIAISGRGTLYVAEGDRTSTGRLFAYRLH